MSDEAPFSERSFFESSLLSKKTRTSGSSVRSFSYNGAVGYGNWRLEHRANDAEKSASSSANLLHTVIDCKYELQEELGRGASGIVYKALHLAFEKTVAIKIIDPRILPCENAVKRFQKEAAVLSTFDNPCIVKFLAYGSLPDARQYMVLEYLEGETLADILLQEGALKQERALPLFLDIARALAYVHARGTVHRDLKPANIMVSSADGVERAVILDFGVYKSLADTAEVSLTRTGLLVGSVEYMSPEQCRCQDVDARSDFYSLGCLMYETLVGKTPMHADSDLATMSNHLNRQIDTISAKFTMASSMELAILRCLRKDPQERFQSAQELMECLSRIEGSPAKKTKKHKSEILRLIFLCALISVFSVCLVFVLQSLKLKHSSSQNDPIFEKYSAEIKSPKCPALNNPSEALKVLDRWLAYRMHHNQNLHAGTHVDVDGGEELLQAEYQESRDRALTFNWTIPPHAAEISELFKEDLRRLSGSHDDSPKHKESVYKYRARLAVSQLINGEEAAAKASIQNAIKMMSKDIDERSCVQQHLQMMAAISRDRANYDDALYYLELMPAVMEVNGMLLPLQAFTIDSFVSSRSILKQTGKCRESDNQFADRLISFLTRMPSDCSSIAELTKLAAILNDLGRSRDVVSLFKRNYSDWIISDPKEEVERKSYLAQAYLNTKSFDKAEPLFAEVRDFYYDSRFAYNCGNIAEKYLYSLKSQNKDYEKPLNSFLKKLHDNKTEEYYFETLLAIKDAAPELGEKTYSRLRKILLQGVRELEGKLPGTAAYILHYEASKLYAEAKYDESLALSERVLELLPDTPGNSMFAEITYATLIRELNIYLNKNDFAKLENTYKRALLIKGLAPDSDDGVVCNYADAIVSKNIDKAIELNYAIVKRFADHPVLHSSFYSKAASDLACWLAKKGRSAEAIAMLEKAYEKVVRDRSDHPGELAMITAVQADLYQRVADKDKARTKKAQWQRFCSAH